MAGVLDYYSLKDKKEIAKGLISLVPGSPANLDAVDGMDAETVQSLTSDAKKKIDDNTKPLKKKPASLILTNTDEPIVLGAKDTLVSYINEELAQTRLQDKEKIKKLEAAMAAGGYEVKMDDLISDDERSHLDDFRARLKNGMSLNTIFNDNYKIAETNLEQQQKTAAAQALEAKNDADINNKYNAALVYAGYLKPEDINKPLGSAEAMTMMIVNVVPDNQQATVQAGMYSNMETFKPNANALQFLVEHTGNTAQIKVEADLESGDPTRIARAQSFLALQGVKADGKDIETNGQIYSAGFKDSAEAFIRKPLTMPAGIIENGVVNTQKLWGMAASGQLYLPEDKLSDADRKAAALYPPASERKDGELARETFIASRLIADDPKKYELMLAEENERRAKATLDVKVEAKVVAIAPGTPVQEEKQIANNPLGITATTSITAGDSFVNQADGKTSQFEILQYNSPDKGMNDFASYLKDHAEGGKVTLGDAIKGLNYASVDEKAAFLAGATGGDSADTHMAEVYGRRLPEQLGYEATHEFDLSKPEEMKAVLTGVTAYVNRQTLGNGNVLIASFEDKMPDAVASIDRVATGKPQLDGSKPAATPDSQTPITVPTPDKSVPIASKSWGESLSEFFVGKAEAKEANPAAATPATPKVQEQTTAPGYTPWAAM